MHYLNRLFSPYHEFSFYPYFKIAHELNKELNEVCGRSVDFAIILLLLKLMLLLLCNLWATDTVNDEAFGIEFFKCGPIRTFATRHGRQEMAIVTNEPSQMAHILFTINRIYHLILKENQTSFG